MHVSKNVSKNVSENIKMHQNVSKTILPNTWCVQTPAYTYQKVSKKYKRIKKTYIGKKQCFWRPFFDMALVF